MYDKCITAPGKTFKIKHIFSALMIFAMAVSLTACGEEITLESRSANGVTLNVPSDFNAFADNNGMQMATDEDSTATIRISAKGDAQGVTASDYAQESYQQFSICRCILEIRSYPPSPVICI